MPRNTYRRTRARGGSLSEPSQFTLDHYEMPSNMDDTSSENTFNAELSPNTIDFIPEVQVGSLIRDRFHSNQFANDGRYSSRCSKIVIVVFTLIASFLLAEGITIVISSSFNKVEEMRQPFGSEYQSKRIPETPCFNAEMINNFNEKFYLFEKEIKHLTAELYSITYLRKSLKMELQKLVDDKLQAVYEKFLHVNVTITKALELYDADKLGMSDYALESAGGVVTAIPNTVPYDTRFSYDIFGIVNIYPRSNPRMLIQPGILPGQCFAFAGSIGWIRILLAHTVQITAVTMEHTYSNLVGDMSSAPKNFDVYGLESKLSERGDFLGSFTYKLNDKNLQTFEVDVGNKTYNNIELHIVSNHGNPLYTCIYRFRVHGNKV